jgi:hypothetical protein
MLCRVLVDESSGGILHEQHAGAGFEVIVTLSSSLEFVHPVERVRQWCARARGCTWTVRQSRSADA